MINKIFRYRFKMTFGCKDTTFFDINHAIYTKKLSFSYKVFFSGLLLLFLLSEEHIHDRQLAVDSCIKGYQCLTTGQT